MTRPPADPSRWPAVVLPAPSPRRRQGTSHDRAVQPERPLPHHWLADSGGEPVLDELTRHAVTSWLADLAETSEPSTVATRLRRMRRLCRWPVAEGEPDVAPPTASRFRCRRRNPSRSCPTTRSPLCSRPARSPADGPGPSTAASSPAAATKSSCGCWHRRTGVRAVMNPLLSSRARAMQDLG
jgi:hypothetical protein